MRDETTFFLSAHDLKPLGKSGVENIVERRVKQASIVIENVEPGVKSDVTPHALRHTAASDMLARGVNIVEVANIMGWSDSTAVGMARRYGRAAAFKRAKAAHGRDPILGRVSGSRRKKWNR